ncbi:glutathione S-transferase family protein [Roseomonas sp. NAR14]|uniref:glutathione transferase n=1 Tax=Roseomonas acroporae TaxID=2937791 RepID=A0A9X1YG89_9PROT|nr:glutathione S-transferase family protein [Roseomonas acroporae]MCK8785701.1 glutathione S-transferase family protein [Roseomonas acroporae]
MLTIHHLGVSQSERIVWLCEELGVPYALKLHRRDPVTILAPAELKALHPIGAAPVIEDDGVVLAESAAVMEFIMARYGDGGLARRYGDADFAPYLYWFHFANGTLQPAMGRCMILERLKLPADNKVLAAMRGRLEKAFGLVEARLGEVPYLAGEAFTAADIISVFSLTTMRTFLPVDLAPYPNIRAYLQRIGGREAYRRAMAKGDPGMTPLLD